MNGLAYPALIATYLGFAGTQGALIYRARREGADPRLALLFGALVFLPSCLALPPNPWLRTALWGLAGIVVIAFSRRPDRLPASLWSAPFAFRYLGGTMALILVWSLGHLASPPLLTMGLLAALAGALAWARGGRALAA